MQSELKLKALFTTVACTVAIAAAPTASAQLSTTANGPYYATPSWDQKLTTNRFVILANWNSEAVLDRETGLVWERSPDATRRFWDSAVIHCNDRSVAGRKGWRLPGMQELASLLDTTVAPPGPMLPAGHPFLNVQSPAFYWSATGTSYSVDKAWIVSFENGYVGSVDRSITANFWCVRGGQGSDVQ